MIELLSHSEITAVCFEKLKPEPGFVTISHPSMPAFSPSLPRSLRFESSSFI